MEQKFGDRQGWVWHVYENEGHGIGYQIELEQSGRTGGGTGTVGPELDRKADAEQIVETFRKTWGGSYVFHSLEEWVAYQLREEES